MIDRPAKSEQDPRATSQVDPLWDAATLIVEKLERTVAADLRERTTVRSLWTQALKAMQGGRVEGMARLLADPRMNTSTGLYPQTSAPLRNVQLAVHRALEARSAQVLRAVEGLAGERGWRTNSNSDRVVIDGLVTVTLTGDGAVKVQARQVRSLEPTEVLRVLETEYARVWTRAREGVNSFALELATLVAEARREADSQGYVRLQDLYNRLKSLRPKAAARLVSYYRDEFSADLSCLVQSPDHRRRFQFSAARDPNLVFSVVLDDGAINQYGYVRLRGDSDDA